MKLPSISPLNIKPTVWLRFSALAVSSLIMVSCGDISLSNYKGYCKAEKKRLTEQELILRAVRTHIRWRKVTEIDPISGELTEMPPTGRSTDAQAHRFLNENPGCCRIGPEPGEFMEQTLYGKLSGRQRAVVVVEYSSRRNNSSGDLEETSRKTQMTLNNCGGLTSD